MTTIVNVGVEDGEFNIATLRIPSRTSVLLMKSKDDYSIIM